MELVLSPIPTRLYTCLMVQKKRLNILTIELLQTVNIKLPDAIIAATALYLDLPLLTFDADFSRIPNLKLFILGK